MKTSSISIQGSRSYMEDRYYINTNFANKGWMFAGVYDGHGGFETAEYASQNLHERFESELSHYSSPLETFEHVYKQMSEEVKDLKGGTCAADLLIKDGVLYCANVGDCRIIVVGDEIIQLTIDHNVSMPEEKERIISSGGLIRGKYVFSDWQGLAVTRSLGDNSHAKVGVISTPSIGSYTLKPTDKYVIIGSDGLFRDFVNKELVESCLRANPDNVDDFASRLKDYALEHGSTDNITVIVITL